jgi:hypothetical protein
MDLLLMFFICGVLRISAGLNIGYPTFFILKLNIIIKNTLYENTCQVGKKIIGGSERVIILSKKEKYCRYFKGAPHRGDEDFFERVCFGMEGDFRR